MIAYEAGAHGNGPPLTKAAEQESKQTRVTPAWWGTGGHTSRLSALPAPAASELLPSRWICGLRILGEPERKLVSDRCWKHTRILLTCPKAPERKNDMRPALSRILESTRVFAHSFNNHLLKVLL